MSLVYITPSLNSHIVLWNNPLTALPITYINIFNYLAMASDCGVGGTSTGTITHLVINVENEKTLKQQKGEISILVDSTKKGYITLYLQIGTSGTCFQYRNNRSEIPFTQIIQAFI
jgi:hypothetical protein